MAVDSGAKQAPTGNRRGRMLHQLGGRSAERVRELAVDEGLTLGVHRAHVSPDRQDRPDFDVRDVFRLMVVVAPERRVDQLGIREDHTFLQREVTGSKTSRSTMRTPRR